MAASILMMREHLVFSRLSSDGGMSHGLTLGSAKTTSRLRFDDGPKWSAYRVSPMYS